MSDRIDELAEQIRACTKCPLHQSRNNAVPGTGSHSARIVLIGEGPGHNEDKQGRPFVGASGKYLDRLLTGCGLDRKDLFVTNVVKCRPPQDRTPTQDEKAQCRDWLEAQLEALQPDIVVTMGAPATQHFAPQTKIGEVHGRPMWVDGRDFLILPMYHPAAAMRQDRYKQPVEEEFPRIREWRDILETDPTEHRERKNADLEDQDNADASDKEAEPERLTPLKEPDRPPRPDSPEPKEGVLLAATATLAAEMRGLLQDEISSGDKDPRETRHTLALLSQAFRTLGEQAERLPPGAYREWVRYRLITARTDGAALGQIVPLTCEECGAPFHCSTEEFHMEQWCPECREA